ncbi:MAG: hypothetical protein ACYDC5_06555 [Candidatus Dormibacteria bacterium]
MVQVSEREVSLAGIVGRMLRPDAWEQFTDGYLEALDEIARRTKAGSNRSGGSSDGYRLRERICRSIWSPSPRSSIANARSWSRWALR